MNYGTITVEELKARRDAGETIRLIDVREPSEFHTAQIGGAELRPLGRIMQWAAELGVAMGLQRPCQKGCHDPQQAAQKPVARFQGLVQQQPHEQQTHRQQWGWQPALHRGTSVCGTRCTGCSPNTRWG